MPTRATKKKSKSQPKAQAATKATVRPRRPQATSDRRELMVTRVSPKGRPAKSSCETTVSNHVRVVRYLRLQGQRLLRKLRGISRTRREECYRKVASMPVAKQETFWKSLVAFLKRGAAGAVAASRAFYRRHWNSLMWSTAGLALGWLLEVLFTVHVPFVGPVRLFHWAWKWISATAGWAYGIWFDHAYRMQTASTAAFA